MGLFEKINSQAAAEASSITAKGSNKTVTITLDTMPETPAEFMALPQATLQSPFDTAAMIVAALCVYPFNKADCITMINYLRGPNPLTARDTSFLADRMAQNSKARFLGASYLGGATPQNDYAPVPPYTVSVSENIYSYDTPGCARLFVKSGGGDSPRPITMRLAKDGKWYLWDYASLLLDVRAPESTNPWA